MRLALGTFALEWADLVVEGSFFVMQIYLTDVWRLSFTTAATLLNIWGGIHRVLPILFLFLADTILGNFITLAMSAVLSTTGLILITVTTGGGYICQEKGGKEECIGYTEKAFFIAGMVLLALGRAARDVSTEPFLEEELGSPRNKGDSIIHSSLLFTIFNVLVPVVTAIAFPYVKKWYLLWGVAAICTAVATLLFFYKCRAYKRRGPRKDGSPVTGLVRVFVISAFKICEPSPKLDDPLLHVDDGEFDKLSASPLLGFLHKAAVKPSNYEEAKKKTKLLRPCSVSEVESAKILIRMVSVHTTYLMCGVVSSVANTYIVEQANSMNTDLGKWKDAPVQLFIMFGNISLLVQCATRGHLGHAAAGPAAAATIFSTICCAVAASIERRRLHVVRRHGVAEGAKAPMTAFWLLFPFVFISLVDNIFRSGLSQFHRKEAPASMERYNGCLISAISGLGYMCGALSVYVVGKVTKMGSGKGWFQHTLNRSRLDRYYWLLSAVTTLNLLICFLVAKTYTSKQTLMKGTELTAQQPKQEAQAQEKEQDLVVEHGDKV